MAASSVKGVGAKSNPNVGTIKYRFLYLAWHNAICLPVGQTVEE